MRCAECGLYECVLRSPMGGCPNGEKAEQAVIFTAPDTAPLDAGALARTTDGLIVEELRIKFNPILRAARELVQTVEGYVCPKKGDKYVFRNEVLAKVKELKEILK